MIKENDESLKRTGKKTVRFFIEDMQEEFNRDMKSGLGFIITDKDGIDKKDEKRKENGIYSPKYGSIWQDENAFQELYSCNCKNMQGKMYLDLVCPKCHTPVIYRDKNIKITGYFIIENYYIIHPTLYRMLSGLIGTKKLKTILYPRWKPDNKGEPIKPIINEKTKNINKYDDIGMIEFYNRFDEIIDFFYQKKKDKKMIYEFIKENRQKVFIKHIPCISLSLRPIVLGDEDFAYAPINKAYAILSNKIYSLNHKLAELTPTNEKTVVKRLAEVQFKNDNITQLLAKSMNKKNGLIRNNIQGSRYNSNTRGVIVPKNYGKINEVDFPYLGFLTMCRPIILNTMCKIYSITINEAYVLWRKAYVKFDKRVYSIMQYLVSHYDMMILLNRNPTIDYGGIQQMRIAKVKPDYDDLTINVPINSLSSFAGEIFAPQAA